MTPRPSKQPSLIQQARYLLWLKLLIAIMGLIAGSFASRVEAQFDFAGAQSVKIRTYPIKQEKGRAVLGQDGMPQALASSNGRPANLVELPAVPVNEDFPGGSILDALTQYQKQDSAAALAAILALLRNSYVELEIEKSCRVDAIKIQYDHRPSVAFPAFQEAGLTSIKQILADGAKASNLFRTEEFLRRRYNTGRSTNPEKDQETMALSRSLRLAIAQRYNPRVVAPALKGLSAQEAKERFKGLVASGKAVEGELFIGPLHLAVRARLEQSEKKPLPPTCKR
jgi:hypothetical protein